MSSTSRRCSAASARSSIRSRRCTSARTASARSRSPTTTPAIGTRAVARRDRAARRTNLWRYRELLPLDGEPTGRVSTWASRRWCARRPLGEALGLGAVGQERRGLPPDAVVQGSRGLGRALARRASSASTPSPAPRRATWPTRRPPTPPQAGLRLLRAHPARSRGGQGARHPHLRRARWSRIDGTYDDVNRLCSEIAGRHPWAFVNVNIRPYYAEGSKTYGFEILEQLGWRTPAHVVVPMAGGLAPHQDRQGDRGVHQARPGRGAGPDASCTARRRRAAGRSPRRCSRGRDAIKPVKQPEHHRQVAGHRQPRRRALRVDGDPRLGRHARRPSATRRSSTRIRAPRRDRGHLHRDRGRRHRRHRQAADRRGQHPARRAHGPLHHRPGAEDAGAAARAPRRARPAIAPAHRRIREARI